MFKKELLKNDAQNVIDSIYGEGEWELLEYEGGHKPCLLKHKCGLEKRPKLTFDELSKRISDLTYGTYELIELIDSTEFIVNHKSCERPPFKTSTMRFFTRGQRCACSKKGRVGKKTKAENEAEINNMIMENKENAN